MGRRTSISTLGGAVLIGAILGGAILVGCTGAGATDQGPTFSPVIESPGEPSGSAGPGASSSIVIDAALLTVLPATVAGLPITESPDGETDALSSSLLPTIATSVAAGLAVDTGSGDLVYALVVKLRPGALTDAEFRSWRDAYDAGACSGASDVVHHAESKLGGRAVFIGTCDNGLVTYHTWIPDKNLLISANSIGALKLGEKLMETLRP